MLPVVQPVSRYPTAHRLKLDLLILSDIVASFPDLAMFFRPEAQLARARRALACGAHRENRVAKPLGP